MTPAAKQMAAFLRSEGWVARLVIPLGQNERVRLFRDPKFGNHFRLETAYRLARRRKGARERYRARKGAPDVR
jgi:hypothetical protein